MYKIDSIVIDNLKLLPSISILTVKDHSAFQNMVTSEYYTAQSSYLSKLYAEIGLKNLGFVRNLYELDPTYAITKITEHLKKLKSQLYTYDSKFIVLSELSYSNYKYIVNKINKFTADNLYAIESTNYNDDSYLFLSNGVGAYVEVSLLNESISLYNAESVDDKLYITKNATYDLNDPDLLKFIDLFFSNMLSTKASIYYGKLESVLLSWSDAVDLLKSVKFEFTDEDNEKIYNMTNLTKLVTRSPYNISSIFKSINNHINDLKLQNIVWIYDKILHEDLKSFDL